VGAATTTMPDASTQPDPNLPLQPIRMVAIDVDGTLLRTDKRLSRRAVDVIRQASESGVRVVLASARPPRSLREIYDLLGLKTFQVNYNGALIYDRQRERAIYHKPLHQDLARQIIATARRADRKCVVSMEILDKWYTDHFDDTLPTETSRQFSPDFIGPLNAFLRVPVTKLMLLAPPRRLAKIRKSFEAQYTGLVSMAVSDEHLIQIAHRDVNKARALSRIAAHYRVPREAVMAIGDAPNDVQMLRWAGMGVAVDNAWPTARKAADVYVPSNDEDGVVHAFERYVLPGLPV